VKIEDTGRADYGVGHFIKPYQQPHPPIAISIMSPNSGSARLAGEQGWIPPRCICFSTCVSESSSMTALQTIFELPACTLLTDRPAFPADLSRALGCQENVVNKWWKVGNFVMVQGKA
jgi:hypothetical protein